MTLTQHTDALDDELCTWPPRPQLFTRANALDQWPVPITPLTQDLVELPQERGLERAFAHVLGVSEPSPPWTWNACFYGYVMFGVTPAAALADNLPGWDRAGVYADYLGVRPDPEAADAAGPPVSPLKVARIGLRFFAALRGYPRRAASETSAARTLLAADRTRDWSVVDDDYLVDRIVDFPDLHVGQREPHAVASVISAALFKQLTATVSGAIGDEATGARLAREMITPLGGVHMREAIEAMADVAAGRMSREAFVDDYGFRGSNEFELAVRPWGEDPATLDRLIAAAGAQRAERDGSTREQARALVQHAAGWRWPLLRRLLGMTETHLRWRENGKVPMALGVAATRLVVREAARRLVRAQRIADPQDVFYLRSTELVAALRGEDVGSLIERIARRRQSRERALTFAIPEIVDAGPTGIAEVSAARWRSLGLIPPPAVDSAAATLTGVGGSRGTATGRARIVTDPADVELDEGDIVVARGTDSAWTPLFLQADAVVVDIGGMMSHACIAAREVGIPCVIDVKSGTTRIQEGQLITVDGDAGTVTLS
jgi:phosphohistidine swiveling domain-containing protein